MRSIAYIIAGFFGFMILIFGGNRLLRDPKVSSRRFALILTIGFALLIIILIIISRPISPSLLVASGVITIFSISFGYPFLYFLHRFRSHGDRSDFKDGK